MVPLAFGMGGPMDLGIVAVVVLVLFGGPKLAGFAKSAGEGIREFKKAATDTPELAAASQDSNAPKSA